MKEKEYKEQCRQIREQIKPREGFLEELKENLQKEVERREKIKRKRAKIIKTTFAFCSVAIISTGAVAFADDIGDYFSKLFKNSDQTSEFALENVIVQEFDMDYIEHDGIGIKINSVLVNDESFDVVLDVRGEIDGKIKFDTVKMKVLEKNINISEEMNFFDDSYKLELNSIDKNNHIIIMKFNNIKKEIFENKLLNISFNKTYIIEKNKIKTIDEIWDYTINIKKQES